MLTNQDAVQEPSVKFAQGHKKSPLGSHPNEFNTDFFGPVLPPHLLKNSGTENQNKEKIYGPTFPDYLSKKEKELSELVENKDEVLIGPAFPEHLKCNQYESNAEEEEPSSSCNANDTFGPTPDLMATGDVISYKFMSRTNPNKNTTNESTATRESWMTELPEKKRANFGLFPRHFKSRIPSEKDTDDSVWTETPASKKKKQNSSSKKDHKEILKIKRLEERDKQMEKLAKKMAKKLRKQESLLEIHLKNVKKKIKKEKKELEKKGKTVPERRPFDRNVDLQITKFDKNQTRAIISKSQFLNDRFAPGQSKFL